MAFDPRGFVKRSGSQSGSTDKNFHIAQHNDRVFTIAKTELNWNDFVNFTSYDKSCYGYKSIEELVKEGELTGLGIERADVRFLLSQYITDKIRYSDQSTQILERLRDP